MRVFNRSDNLNLEIYEIFFQKIVLPENLENTKISDKQSNRLISKMKEKFLNKISPEEDSEARNQTRRIPVLVSDLSQLDLSKLES